MSSELACRTQWTSEGHLGSTKSDVVTYPWNDGSTTVLVDTQWTPKVEGLNGGRDARVQLFIPDLATLESLIANLQQVRDTHVNEAYHGE